MAINKNSKIKVRSKFERTTVDDLKKKKVKFEYESLTIKYQPKVCTYTPDILLDNGIIIELKGYFRPDDRMMHKLIREQHPNLDIRFVFMSSKNKIHKNSTTTYGSWCDQWGFKYSDKTIPQAWIDEPKKNNGIGGEDIDWY